MTSPHQDLPSPSPPHDLLPQRPPPTMTLVNHDITQYNLPPPISGQVIMTLNTNFKREEEEYWTVDYQFKPEYHSHHSTEHATKILLHFPAPFIHLLSFADRFRHYFTTWWSSQRVCVWIQMCSFETISLVSVMSNPVCCWQKTPETKQQENGPSL